MARLRAVKPDRPDDRLHLPGLRAGERLRRRVAGEESVPNGVDGAVGRLRREDREDQRLVRVMKVEKMAPAVDDGIL